MSMEQFQLANPELVNAPSWYSPTGWQLNGNVLLIQPNFCCRFLCKCTFHGARGRPRNRCTIGTGVQWEQPQCHGSITTCHARTRTRTRTRNRSPITSMLHLKEGSHICVIAETCAARRNPAQAVVW